MEQGGNLVTQITPNVRKPTLRGAVNENVKRGSLNLAHELMSYGLLTGDGHSSTVRHAAMESPRARRTRLIRRRPLAALQASVRSTLIQISGKQMQRNPDEFTFRANHRSVNAVFGRVSRKHKGGRRQDTVSTAIYLRTTGRTP
jgi:transposase